MTITLSPTPFTTFISEHPWPTVTLAIVLGIVLPAVWSSCPERRAAATELIRMILDAAAHIVLALRGSGRP